MMRDLCYCLLHIGRSEEAIEQIKDIENKLRSEERRVGKEC